MTAVEKALCIGTPKQIIGGYIFIGIGLRAQERKGVGKAIFSACLQPRFL